VEAKWNEWFRKTQDVGSCHFIRPSSCSGLVLCSVLSLCSAWWCLCLTWLTGLLLLPLHFISVKAQRINITRIILKGGKKMCIKQAWLEMGTVMKRMESVWNETRSCFPFVYAQLQRSSCHHIDTSYRANEWYILVDILWLFFNETGYTAVPQYCTGHHCIRCCKPVVLAVVSIVK